jgi:hypothetical protein
MASYFSGDMTPRYGRPSSYRTTRKRNAPKPRVKKCAGWHTPAHVTDLPLATVRFMNHRTCKFCPSCLRAVLTDESLSPEDRRIVEFAYQLAAFFYPPGV